MNELSALALGDAGIDDLLRAAIDRVALVLDVPMASVVEVLAADDALVRAVGGARAETHVGLRFRATPDTLTGRVLADGVSAVVEEFATDDRFSPTSEPATGCTAPPGS